MEWTVMLSELRAVIRNAAKHPKLGVQHDLEKHPSNRAKTGWHISTRRQAYQSTVRANRRAFAEIAICREVECRDFPGSLST